METVTKEKEAKLENELAVKFITLISKLAATYDSSIKEWQSYPNVDDIIVKENQQQYIKKISITLKVLLRKAEKNNEIHKNKYSCNLNFSILWTSSSAIWTGWFSTIQSTNRKFWCWYQSLHKSQ